jgi:hypothetical protein
MCTVHAKLAAERIFTLLFAGTSVLVVCQPQSRSLTRYSIAMFERLRNYLMRSFCFFHLYSGADESCSFMCISQVGCKIMQHALCELSLLQNSPA